MTTTLIVGDGYVGSAVADQLAASVDVRTVGTVVVTSRSIGGVGQVLERRAGVLAISLDVTDPRTFETIDRLPRVDRVLYSVGYQRTSSHSRDEVHVTGQKRLLAFLRDRFAGDLPHVVTLSTTGVYEQTGGQWVDENSPTRPQREGGQTHLRSEAVLSQNWPHDRSTILRLAGIYGPGRWPNRHAIASGEAINADPDSFLNLIHRDDIATAVIAAMDRRVAGLYCLADDNPVRRRDYYDAVARSVGMSSATFETNGCIGARRSISNKRIWNRKAKRDLVSRWKYPNSLDVVSRPPA